MSETLEATNQKGVKTLKQFSMKLKARKGLLCLLIV
jgi:hypothetical protein